MNAVEELLLTLHRLADRTYDPVLRKSIRASMVLVAAWWHVYVALLVFVAAYALSVGLPRVGVFFALLDGLASVILIHLFGLAITYALNQFRAFLSAWKTLKETLRQTF